VLIGYSLSAGSPISIVVREIVGLPKRRHLGLFFSYVPGMIGAPFGPESFGSRPHSE